MGIKSVRKWGMKGTQIFVFPPPMSAKISNKFDYSMKGGSVTTASK